LKVLNDLVSDLPIAIIQGHIAEITAIIPWKNLWIGSCTLELQDLRLVVKPLADAPEAGK